MCGERLVLFCTLLGDNISWRLFVRIRVHGATLWAVKLARVAIPGDVMNRLFDGVAAAALHGTTEIWPTMTSTVACVSSPLSIWHL